VTDLVCQPSPIQKPHGPISGGGSKWILMISGQEADIVGITTRARADGSKDSADNTAAATYQKIAWVREAARPQIDQIELSDIHVAYDRQGDAERILKQHGT
jgi:hypothetical protein